MATGPATHAVVEIRECMNPVATGKLVKGAYVTYGEWLPACKTGAGLSARCEGCIGDGTRVALDAGPVRVQKLSGTGVTAMWQEVE